MHIKSWPTTPIARLFHVLGGLALVRMKGIEALEHETAVVAKQFMQPKQAEKENRIVVIALNPLTVASRTLHPAIVAGLDAGQCVIMSPMQDLNDEMKRGRDLDPLIEAYKKDIDITLIRENLRLTVDQRFQQLMKLQQFAEDLRRAGRKARSQK